MNDTQRVEAILKAVPKTRDSDKELQIIYWQKAGLELTDRQIAKLRQMPSSDTITRIRRKLQEQGKYPASESVNNARYEKYKSVRENINHESPEQLLERQGVVVLPWGE